MAPIRVGIVGLRASDTREGLNSLPGFWAVTAHLSSIEAMPENYEIVAIANSSVESAEKAIEAYGLPAGTKAYDNPEDIANDPRVELVVISVNVLKHFDLAKPALLKKKNVLVEWPLAAKLSQAEELTKIAAEAGVKTIVGLQARADPFIVKLKELLASNKIGRVLSSSVMATTMSLPIDAWIEGAEYYLDINSGGNEFSIYLGHFLDTFIHVLGDFTSIQAMLVASQTSIPVMNMKGEIVNPSHPKTAPDHVFVQGMLESNAIASIAMRKAQAAVDNVGWRWIITGTEGEIEVTMPENHWQFGDAKRSLKLKIGKGEAEDVDFLAGDILEGKVAAPGTNTARAYQGFAKGDTEVYATFESALKSQKLIDRILMSAGWQSV